MKGETWVGGIIRQCSDSEVARNVKTHRMEDQTIIMTSSAGQQRKSRTNMHVLNDFHETNKN
jgi:hypothetical protein